MIVIGTALGLDFTDGFHDTASATSTSTRAIGPKQAVALASLPNFSGAFISLKVATTIGQGFVDTDAVTPTVVFAGLPSSSSHALIRGLVGATRSSPRSSRSPAPARRSC